MVTEFKEEDEVLKLDTDLSKEQVGKVIDTLAKSPSGDPMIDLEGCKTREDAIKILLPLTGSKKKAYKMLDQVLFKAQALLGTHKTHSEEGQDLH